MEMDTLEGEIYSCTSRAGSINMWPSFDSKQQKDGSDGNEESKRRAWRKENLPKSVPPKQVTAKPKPPQDKLPLIGSPGHKTTAPPQPPQRPSPHVKRKRAATTGHLSTAPPPPDRMAPWEGPALSDSSFTSIPRPPPPPPPPLLPPAPPPSTTTPNPSQPIIAQSGGRSGGRVRRARLPPPRRPPRPPRLPPLRPVSNLSFTRSFTFSFFELPLHQSAHSRAERLKDLTVLLRQTQY
ncbi:uncharacterized protein LOC134457429 [Engraulis encrasicolus]|uniref:uncharacterized protein LOC134457429 n=1 Tax=Engraulis encrasicolus TaxID=184585 RepID=UPI002FCFC31B